MDDAEEEGFGNKRKAPEPMCAPDAECVCKCVRKCVAKSPRIVSEQCKVQKVLASERKHTCS